MFGSARFQIDFSENLELNILPYHKTHLDRLENGLIIRLISQKNIQAIGISLEEIENVELQIEQDTFYPKFGSIFHFLVNRGFNPNTVKFFANRRFGEIIKGKTICFIRLQDGMITLIWSGSKKNEIMSHFNYWSPKNRS